MFWTAQDCSVFKDPSSRNPDRNDIRLILRRRLEEAVQQAWGEIPELPVVRSSLSHPHAFNHMRVTHLSVNFGRGKAECALLKKELGDAAPLKPDSPSLSLHAFVRLDEGGLSAGLLLPADAWWDYGALLAEGQEDRDVIFSLAKSLASNATLETPSWIQPEPLSTLERGQWRRVMKSLQPGQHSLVMKFTYGNGDNPLGFLASCREPLVKLFMAMKWKNQETNPI